MAGLAEIWIISKYREKDMVNMSENKHAEKHSTIQIYKYDYFPVENSLTFIFFRLHKCMNHIQT